VRPSTEGVKDFDPSGERPVRELRIEDEGHPPASRKDITWSGHNKTAWCALPLKIITAQQSLSVAVSLRLLNEEPVMYLINGTSTARVRLRTCLHSSITSSLIRVKCSRRMAAAERLARRPRDLPTASQKLRAPSAIASFRLHREPAGRPSTT
jgi:hypothetical protein